MIQIRKGCVPEGLCGNTPDASRPETGPQEAGQKEGVIPGVCCYWSLPEPLQTAISASISGLT